jgi:hypothetical protein
MRSFCVTITVTLACSLLAAAVVVAQPSRPATDGLTEQPGVTREEAVALVLATDPRFTDLPDYEVQRRKMASQFSLMPVLGSDHYHVLPTLTAQASGPDWDYYGYPSNWLIEVALIRRCVEPAEDSGPWADPCEWRHNWFYRVTPDGDVALLFEEGDLRQTPVRHPLLGPRPRRHVPVHLWWTHGSDDQWLSIAETFEFLPAAE